MFISRYCFDSSLLCTMFYQVTYWKCNIQRTKGFLFKLYNYPKDNVKKTLKFQNTKQ